MRSVELFTGAGGLAMGLSLAGVKPLALVERDRWACDTIRVNAERGFPLVADWPLIEGDVRDFDMAPPSGGADIVAGGPPCQPFSMGGKHRAYRDDRDMFPVAVDVVRRLRPRAFIFENVRGLTRPSFGNYFQYVLLQMTFPEIRRKESEMWTDHLAVLERMKTRARHVGLTYNVVSQVLNAADFGVPQKRERVFIVGFRDDLDVLWSFPEPTHSLDGLLESQWLSDDYWDRHEISARRRPPPPDRMARRIDAMWRRNFHEPGEPRPWRTVRDAFADMPSPDTGRGESGFHNHGHQPGARPYKGHTGSPLDLPAKALKAGDHGVPGGENMMVLDDDSTRYYTVREAARLQCFPDGYVFHGAWSETMRQLGNAVPVSLSRAVAASVAASLARRPNHLAHGPDPM